MPCMVLASEPVDENQISPIEQDDLISKKCKPPAIIPLCENGSNRQGIVANRAEQERKSHFVITPPDYKMIRSTRNFPNKKQRDGMKRNVF